MGKPPMRGRGRRPPMGSSGMQHQQQQQSYNNMQQSMRGAMRGGRGRGSMMNRGRGRGRGVSSGYQQQAPSYQQQPNYANTNYQQQVMPQSYNQQQVVPQIQNVQRVQPQQVMNNTQSMNIPQIQNMNIPQMNMQQNVALNTMNVSAQQPNMQQSRDLNAQKPRSRPPISRTQNNDMFAQFNASQQQQQQVPMQQVQPMPIQQQQQQVIANNVVQNNQSVQQERDEQKAMLSPNQSTPKKPIDSTKSSKAMSSPKTINRQPPWLEFTGEKRKPIKAGWAHRVRQVMSADTLRIALLKPKGQNLDPLDGYEIIQVTLDGIEAPRTQRFGAALPTKSDAKNNKKSKKSKDEESEKSNAYDGSAKDGPFAFAAREFVRSKICNKNIFYAVWKSNSGRTDDQQNASSAPRNPRFWGDIYYQEGKGQTKSLTNELIANGYAKLKALNIYNNLSETEKKRLQRKEDDAKAKKLRVWSVTKENKDKAVRDIQ